MKWLPDHRGSRLFRVELAAGLIGAFISLFLAKSWGPEWQGQWSILNNFTATVAMVVTAGLPSVLISLIRRKKINEASIAKRLLNYLLTMGIVIGAICFILTLWPRYEFLISKLAYHTGGYLLMSLQILFIIAMNILAAWADAKNKLAHVSSIRLIINIALGFAVVICYFIYQKEMILLVTAVWYVFIIQSVVMALIMLQILSGTPIQAPSINTQHSVWSLIAQSGWIYLLADFCQKLNYRLDIWFLSAYRTTDQVGIYSVAASISIFLLLRARNAQRTLINSFSITDEQVNYKLIKDETKTLIRELAGIILLFLLAASILFYFFLGTEYRAGYPILYLLVAGIFFVSLTMPISAYFVYKNIPKYNLLSAATGLIINIVLNRMMIPTWGIWGAAMASLITYLAISVTLYGSYLKLIKSQV